MREGHPKETEQFWRFAGKVAYSYLSSLVISNSMQCTAVHVIILQGICQQSDRERPSSFTTMIEFRADEKGQSIHVSHSRGPQETTGNHRAGRKSERGTSLRGIPSSRIRKLQERRPEVSSALPITTKAKTNALLDYRQHGRTTLLCVTNLATQFYNRERKANCFEKEEMATEKVES